jgi:hypothetical protein
MDDQTKCVYCAVRDAETWDHVPPRNIFPPPRPSNLITVPSCVECNTGSSRDDEYFRYVLSMSDATGSNPQAALARESSTRSLLRPEANGYRRAMMALTQPIEIRSPTGIILGTRLGYQVQYERIFRVVRRVVRGLFFHIAGYPLTSEYQPLVHSKDTITNLDQEAQDEFQSNIIHPLWALSPTVISEGTFSYRCRFFEEDPHFSAWGLSFYDTFDFLALTGPPPSAGESDDD